MAEIEHYHCTNGESLSLTSNHNNKKTFKYSLRKASVLLQLGYRKLITLGKMTAIYKDNFGHWRLCSGPLRLQHNWRSPHNSMMPQFLNLTPEVAIILTFEAETYVIIPDCLANITQCRLLTIEHHTHTVSFYDSFICSKINS